MTTWHAIVGLILSSFGIILGALYFTSNRRHAEMKDLRDRLDVAITEQERLRERVAVVEEARRNLDSQLKTLCETMDKKTDGIVSAQKDMLARLEEQFTFMLSEVKSTLSKLQDTITLLQIKIGS